jgi:GMP reductase
MNQELNYQDVYMIPRKTIVGSRKECDTSVTLGKYTFDMPVIASNMKSVVNKDTCLFLAKNRWFYVMHRFDIDVVEFIRFMHDHQQFASISIGVNDDSYQDIRRMVTENTIPEFITLDIANAWCIKAELMTRALKIAFPNAFLIVGNVATSEAVLELESWGADCCKVGIGSGLVCTTKLKTGFHRPMVNTIQDCVRFSTKKIIADGGIVQHGDIAKAISLGAHMVMCGGLFSGFAESAGKILEIDNQLKKSYYGSASEANKNSKQNLEGKHILVDYKGPMENLLIELKQDLQSAISYAGGIDLTALMNVTMVKV